ncbi:phospholipase D-like domain-containing protein [Ralstonia sp. A12]|uniref:phospholipase D-like domain-containing protein n=1 Tax=Ralstonia sp. A12 TaxID=1217052 RepID=UPI000A04F9E9|nr:phosphatidylserine/phosphatidylglycerophosphate/cardiolipin synthase family protein [Ralstonia sp. A12]
MKIHSRQPISPPTETNADPSGTTRSQTGALVRRSSSGLLDCLRPRPSAKPTVLATPEGSARATTRRLGNGIQLPGISAALRLETAVLKASIACAASGTVRPESMVSENNRLESIDIGGDSIFAKQAELVRRAQEEVCVQTFAWDPGSAGAKMILDAMLDAAAAHRQHAGPCNKNKLRVRLLVNEGTGFAQTFMRMTSANKNKGGPKRWPSSPDALIGNYKKDAQHKYASLTRDIDFQVRVYQHRSSNSIHSKAVVVDGNSAALTGANVQSRNHGDNPAYDLGVTVSGGVAKTLREDFVSNWNVGVNPDQQTYPMQEWASLDRASNSATKGIKMAILTRRPNGNLLNARNDNPQNQAFLAAINNARSSIQVMTPNLNAPTALQELANAANRGVRVQVLVSKGFNDDRVNNRIAGGTNRAAISTLRKMVKNNDMLDVRYFKNPKIGTDAPVPDGNSAGNGASHVKFMAVDGAMTIIGSANMDKTSWHFSGETNAAIFDRSATHQIKAKVFDPAWDVSEKTSAC